MKEISLATLLAIILFACSENSEKKSEEHHYDHHHTDNNMSNKHMNQTDFETLVERFDDPERDKWQEPDKVIALFGDLSGKKIADIGSGTGYFSFKLANKGANVLAIDVDKRFTEFINEKKSDQSIETRLVGYDDPALRKNEVDGILTVNTYHHFDDKIDYMNKCYKGLKKGGKIMIVDFKKKDTPHGPPADHRISGTEIKSDLEIAGFTSISIDSKTLKEQNIIIAIK